jgi:hypothetical protein
MQRQNITDKEKMTVQNYSYTSFIYLHKIEQFPRSSVHKFSKFMSYYNFLSILTECIWFWASKTESPKKAPGFSLRDSNNF